MNVNLSEEDYKARENEDATVSIKFSEDETEAPETNAENTQTPAPEYTNPIDNLYRAIETLLMREEQATLDEEKIQRKNQNSNHDEEITLREKNEELQRTKRWNRELRASIRQSRGKVAALSSILGDDGLKFAHNLQEIARPSLSHSNGNDRSRQPTDRADGGASSIKLF